MLENKANIGCGYDIKEGWANFDVEMSSDMITSSATCEIWDVTNSPDKREHNLTQQFEFILVNHVLCTMNHVLAYRALINLHRCLKPGGVLQIIDMDLLKVIKSYQEGRYEDIPIEEGSPDAKLCNAISGYSTRNSLYTPERLKEVLTEAGFREIRVLENSEYDTRPKESLVLEAIK